MNRLGYKARYLYTMALDGLVKAIQKKIDQLTLKPELRLLFRH